MSAQPLPRITPESCLAMERVAGFKSEYFEGRVLEIYHRVTVSEEPIDAPG